MCYPPIYNDMCFHRRASRWYDDNAWYIPGGFIICPKPWNEIPNSTTNLNFRLATNGFMFQILHDWNDEKCVSILRCCRQAIGDDKSSCLLAVDSVVPAGNIPHFSKVEDIMIMVFTSGHERTEQEFRDLFEKADFKLTRITMTPSPVAIVEAIPA